ncbi:HD domain-containing protein [Bacillus sp. HNG]|uniref:HD-GYP domain-containing protein n=1 Tax=Bacillus sp. HNG TaxID=2293325 RepID=UPI000E2EA1D3|nr:HD domain-containing phosphohydrolase [Bacillus sp. HNG]RFB18003.1 HD domain-containing protein [Bacillus sp. HNG]
MQHKRSLILFISLFIFFMAGCQNQQETLIKNGEIVIQPKDEILNLAGYWNFYPYHLLSPSDLESQKYPPKHSMKVPGYWGTHKGYGTYQLDIHFPINSLGQTKAIYIPQVFSAYTLWINNHLVIENGKVAKTKDQMVPKGTPKVIFFNVSQENTQVLLQVSNFHFRDTGIMGPVYLGNPSEIEHKAKRDTFIEWFSIGAFLIISFNHLNIFFNRRKDRVPLYFGLFCLVYGFSILLVGQTSILYFFPDLSWNVVLKLNFLTIFCSVLLFIKYFSLKFPTGQKKIPVQIVMILSVICIVIVLVTESVIFTNLVYILYVILLITFSYILYLIMKGIKLKQVGAYVIGLSLLILIGTAINDLMFDAQMINTTILSPLGIVAFIGAQSIIITKRYAESFSENEMLSSELEATQKEILFTLGEITETRSKETGNHVRRVAEYSKLLALKYGLSKEEAELLKSASPLHDVGKIGIPDSILNKPQKLTKEEYEIMKTHTTIGYQMLKHSNRRILDAAAIIALTHHEKYDGSGYPEGLKGEEIPLYGRIAAISDVFDALSTDRVYKKAWEMKRIMEYFKDQKGKHFDPQLVDLFLENINEFVSIKESFNGK